MRISDIFYFAQGNVRYFLVKCFGESVLRSHIAEQVMMRTANADRECLSSGACKICGCHMPALLYADKSCDKPCYPPMMGKREWFEFKLYGGNDEWILRGLKLRKVDKIYEI